MALTPVEIRHMTPGRSLFGYNAGATDRLLEEIASSFEDVWRERADLADKVEQLESDLVRYRELEALLRTTLVSAATALTMVPLLLFGGPELFGFSAAILFGILVGTFSSTYVAAALLLYLPAPAGTTDTPVAVTP